MNETPSPHTSIRTRRAVAAFLVAAALATGALATPATGERLDRAERRLHRIRDQARDHRRTLLSLRRHAQRLASRTRTAKRQPDMLELVGRKTDASPRRLLGESRLSTLASLRRSERARMRRVRRRMSRLDRAEGRDEDLIWRIRPIGFCPVRGPNTISDDFGAARWDEGKYHAHMGNDISAAYGTPVVAPFDGTAVAAPNALGGYAVKVNGAAGYVYNAHLSSYGQLGPVRAGAVIGYVGATGNALGPHDHFEWHPGGGPAVDPHELLLQVC